MIPITNSNSTPPDRRRWLRFTTVVILAMAAAATAGVTVGAALFPVLTTVWMLGIAGTCAAGMGTLAGFEAARHLL